MVLIEPIPRDLPETSDQSRLRGRPTERPQVAAKVGSKATRPIIINLCEDEEASLPAKRSRPNPFQRHTRVSDQAIKPTRQQTDPVSLRPRRRIRSPSAASSNLEGQLTPSSSEDVSDSDLAVRIARSAEEVPHASPSQIRSGGSFMNSREAVLLGERLDRRFPVRLQLHKDEGCRAALSNLGAAGGQSSISGPTARKVNHGHKTHRASSHQKGTENNPIKLDSDDDDEGMTGSVDRNHALSAAEAGDPMDIDEDDGDLTYSRDVQATGPSISDALLAQQLHDQERLQHVVVRRRDCIVCGDSILINEFPSLAKCEHIPQTCAVCYSTWIARQLEDSGWKEARCPENKCKTKLEYYEIQQTITPEVFQRFDDMMARNAIGEDPNFEWCRNCGSGQIHMSGVEGNIFTCAACGHKMCIVHKNTRHEGETCEDYEYRSSGRKERDQKAQEAASLKAIGSMSKKCPGPNCVYNIEKNDGCDHMTCSRCSYEFCWICLCDYNKVRIRGNSAHARNCNYYA
ncbi:hypothetical protein HBI24_014500 [Parastagonospora nodorum]|nr:hypothetical protein HBH53_093940 [Parastagonospora nodorum]KAH4273537.1 hypothetical protein HBI03_017630 [Parastagonospora nodorum]KAH4283768.1 hypothetical protein HBI04_002380 [Parastagonospora nodorum]KAH4968308.1 hypothetical protein HBI78_067290 [Parastagonospora nodorum]KAH5043602.1 hypothetical protein HBI74_018770 [Parastagonospora nodorum]